MGELGKTVRNTTIIKGLVGSVFLVTVTCSIGNSNEGIGKGGDPIMQVQGFEDFVESFETLSLPFKVDSGMMRNMLIKDDYVSMSDWELKYFDYEKFSEPCEGGLRYDVKKVGKIDKEGKVYLIFFVDLSGECPIDAYECYYVGISYNVITESVLDRRIIGLLYEEFGLSKYQYFDLYSEAINLCANVVNIKVALDSENPDIEYKESSKHNFCY